MKELKEIIITLYYKDHLLVKDIAAQNNVTSAYVTKVIKTDLRYIQEKEYRKTISRNKRTIINRQNMKNKRETKRREDSYAIIKAKHEQASRELSKSNYLTNENYRKWNSSAYKYNPSKRRYEFDEKLGRSYAVPKYIKER